MSNEVAALVAIIVVPMLSVAAVVLFLIWVLFNEINQSKKLKEDAEKLDVQFDESGTKRHLVRSLVLMGGGWLFLQPLAREPQFESLAPVGAVLFILGLVVLMFWLAAEAEESSRKKKILTDANLQFESNDDSQGSKD